MISPASPLHLAESAINGVLRLDPEFLEALDTLSDRIIAVELDGLDQIFHFSLSPQGIVFFDENEIEEMRAGGDADVRFTGTPPALLRMLRQMRRGEGSFADEVRISGDLAVLEALRDAFRRLDVDLEGLLSSFVGDMAAHQIGRAIRDFLSWGNRTRDALLMDAGEYLVEELRVSPPRYQLEDFAAEVDRLRNDVERLEKRVLRLK